MNHKVSEHEKARQKVPRGVWLMALFAVPFAVAGLAILLLLVVPAIYDGVRMQSWEPVPAQVELAFVQNHPASRWRTAYTVAVRYRYQFEGRRYEGTRASISARPDNIGDFQQRLGRRLQDARHRGSSVPVWVNPQNPAESIVDRSFRPRLLANTLGGAVVCGGIGALLLVVMARRFRDGVALDRS